MARLPLNHSINLDFLPRRILDRRTGLLFWQWREAQVGFDDLHLREQALRLLALDARMYDHIITYTRKISPCSLQPIVSGQWKTYQAPN